MHVRLPKPSRRFSIAAVAVLVAISGAGIVAFHLSRTGVQIPRTITNAVTFPLYVPKNLPEGYTLDIHSFKNVAGEAGGVFVFQANDTAGDSLVFSEQAKPANVSFSDFESQQMTNPKKLPNVPYPTTAGQTLDRQTTLLSIVTDKTWIIATTKAELTNQQLHDIATGISKY